MASERLVDCSHSLYPRVMASGDKPRGHPCHCPIIKPRCFFLDCFPPASHAVAMTRGENTRRVAMTRWECEARFIGCQSSHDDLMRPLIVLSHFIPASWRAAISRAAIHALVPYHQNALFFLDCFPPASHAVAMTRGRVRHAVAMMRWGE
jgi:hypothetical protein